MRTIRVIALAGIIVLLGAGGPSSHAHSDGQHFAATDHTVRGAFLSYWQGQGGLTHFGYPLTEEISETSPLDGKRYTVQYFERAEFELHPENPAPYKVLLTQLGTLRYQDKYPTGAPDQQASPDHPYTFAATGHTIGGRFRSYWEANGGLASFGYPLSDQFSETSELDGQTYTVQYFERAVFELHPANPPPHDVLLSQLGRFRYEAEVLPLFHIAPQAGRWFGMKASGNYVTWLEDTNNPRTSHLLFGYDIRSGQIITVSTMGRDYISMDGSTVWWEELDSGNDIGGVRAIIGQDLASGQQRIFPVDKGTQFSYPTSYGRTLAFISWDNAGATLSTRDLDSGQRSQIANPSGIERVAISDRYIVWLEIEAYAHAGSACDIMAYDRRSGRIRPAVTKTNAGGACSYALEGSKLVWSFGGGLSLTDLDNDAPPRTLFNGSSSNPAMKDGTIVWSGQSTSPARVNGLWGLRPSDDQPRLLVSAPRDRDLTNPQIAGASLVYLTPAAIIGVPIAQAFAATINPHPSPTQLPVQMVSLPYQVGNGRADHKISGGNILYLGQPSKDGPLEAYGYNLAAQQVFTSATAVANGVDANDSVLVWEQQDNQNGCSACPINLVAEDILSGQRYAIGGGSMVHASHRHAVAWVKPSKDEFGFSVSKIMYQNLDSGQIIEIGYGIDNVRAIALAVSDNYVVWQEGPAVNVYDLLSGTKRIVAADMPPYDRNFALDGNHIVWGNGSNLFYQDLDAGAAVTLYRKRAEAVFIKGDYVLWSGNGGFNVCGPCDIWGMKLSDRQPLTLISGYTDIYQPQVVGDYLLWQDLQGSNTLYTPLAAAFAAQP